MEYLTFTIIFTLFNIYCYWHSEKLIKEQENNKKGDK